MGITRAELSAAIERGRLAARDRAREMRAKARMEEQAREIARAELVERVRTVLESGPLLALVEQIEASGGMAATFRAGSQELVDLTAGSGNLDILADAVNGIDGFLAEVDGVTIRTITIRWDQGETGRQLPSASAARS